MQADIHFSDEEYKKILQLKQDRGMDYMTDKEFLEFLLKEKMSEIREQVHELELQGKTELPDQLKIEYYLEHLLDD